MDKVNYNAKTGDLLNVDGIKYLVLDSFPFGVNMRLADQWWAKSVRADYDWLKLHDVHFWN